MDEARLIEILEGFATRLEARMDRLEARMDRLEARMDRLETEVSELRSQVALRSDLDALRSEVALRSEMKHEAEVTRRRFDVVAEDLRGEIRLVAEGFLATNERIDRFQEDVRHEFADVRHLITVTCGNLNQRVTALEIN